MNPRSLGALAAALLVTVSCSNDKGKQKQLPVPVAVARVTHRNVPYNIIADGLVEAMQAAQVQAQVTGVLTRVSFKEGDDVREGQVLFQIDPQPYKAALDQATANLAKDIAIWTDAKAEAERYSQLVQKDYATKEQADQMVATEGSSAAAAKADSAAVEQAQINLRWTTITAPISGRTGQVLVKKGNLVRSGTQQPLVVINQIQPILVHFAVPATTLPAIQQYAAKSTGPLPVTVQPGLPPSATAQPTLNGPTPAYTTEPSDDQQSQSVGVGDDPATGSGANGSGPPSGPPVGTSTGNGSGSGHRGGHRGQGAGSATAAAGDPPGPTTSAAGGSPSGGGGADGPPNVAGTPGGRRNGAGTDSAGAPGAAATPRARRPASMPGLPGVPMPAPEQGTLTLVDNQVDTTTGTVLLKAVFPNPSRALWPGQFVATTIRLFTEENALVVPAQAVVMGQQGTYVYLVDQSGTARQRQVVVERTSANTAVIASGLTEGDQVVTDGQSRLTPGAKVNIRGLVPAGNGGATPAQPSSSG
jgi:multidrug efflux pump subunit AcrA (membrane-fusion protein)